MIVLAKQKGDDSKNCYIDLLQNARRTNPSENIYLKISKLLVFVILLTNVRIAKENGNSSARDGCSC